MQRKIASDVSRYAGHRLFFDADEDEILLRRKPYRRPTRTYDNSFINYEIPLTRDTQASNSALSAHRMLHNIYETDNLILPAKDYPGFWQDFQDFYSIENIANGEAIRDLLEAKAFAFLQDEIDLSGPWTAETAVEFFNAFLEDEKAISDKTADSSPVLNAILTSPDPKRCARHFLIQLAPDFLSEASAMAKIVDHFDTVLCLDSSIGFMDSWGDVGMVSDPDSVCRRVRNVLSNFFRLTRPGGRFLVKRYRFCQRPGSSHTRFLLRRRGDGDETRGLGHVGVVR